MATATPARSHDALAELLSLVNGADIKVGGAQTTKTRKALEFFSKPLRPT